MKQTKQLVEIIARARLQALQDMLAKHNGMTTFIVDANGNRLTHPENWKDFCGVFTKAAETEADCRATLMDMLARSRGTSGPIVADCPHTGLTTATVPILIDGEYCGAWVFGQMRIRNPSDMMTARLAKRLGVTPATVWALLERLPRITLEAYQALFKLLRLVNQCVQVAFSRTGPAAAISVLEMVGEHLGVRHGYCYLRDGDTVFQRVQVWHRGDAPAREGAVLRLDAPDVVAAMQERFAQDGGLFASDVSLLSPALYDFLQPMDIQAIALLPFGAGDVPDGFIGFDDAEYRQWRPEEMALLACVCAMIADREQARIQKSSEREEEPHPLTEALNSATVEAIVCDMDTHEVLWSNRAFRMRHGFVPETGSRRCHEAMHGRRKACDNCCLDEHLKASGASVFERADARTGRVFLVHHSPVRWQADRRAYIEYAFDITDYQQCKGEIAHYARTDLLTGALSKAAVLEALTQAMASTGEPLSVAVVDVGGGRRAGDGVLRGMVQAVRHCVRGGDVIGRIDEDVLLVVFPRCEMEIARRRMDKALDHFVHLKPKGHGGNLVSRYGLAERQELGGEGHLEALLSLASRRMRGVEKITPGVPA